MRKLDMMLKEKKAKEEYKGNTDKSKAYRHYAPRTNYFKIFLKR